MIRRLGLTSAARTSLAAYMGSLADAADAPVFTSCTGANCPLESESPLESVQLSVGAGGLERAQVDATPSLADVLPTTAFTFFHSPRYLHWLLPLHLRSLRQLSAQAAVHSNNALLTRCKENMKVDRGAMLAHARAVSAPRAWAWKNVISS